jgi:type II secretory pathway component PulC
LRNARPAARAFPTLAVCCLTFVMPGAVARPAEPAPPPGAPAWQARGEQALQRTSLPMVLVGVMVDSRDPSRSACLVRCAYPIERRGASFLEVGATACDRAEIREIREDGVIVRNLSADRLEFLPLPQGSQRMSGPVQDAAPPPAPAVMRESTDRVDIEVPKETVDHYLVNLPELMKAARAAPRYQDAPNGQRVIEGFEITQITSGSVVEKLGLKSGDVILEVNGERLDGMAAVLRLLGQAQGMGQATLTVQRGTQRMTFRFNTK